jgi:hypothetical protein
MSSTVETSTEIRPFHLDVPEEELVELGRRIAAVRWPSKELVPDRSQGVQLATLQELARYWASDYDWRKAQMTPKSTERRGRQGARGIRRSLRRPERT